MRGIKRFVTTPDGARRPAAMQGSELGGMEESVLTGETGLVEAVLSTATHHDTECLQAENNLRHAFKAQSFNDADLENLFNDWRDAITELCAALATAARARTKQLVPFARQLITTGAIEAMDEEGIDSFLRPIFEDAGIADRFVVEQKPREVAPEITE